MRPPELPGGKQPPLAAIVCEVPCFNEAAGITRRKATPGDAWKGYHRNASMRPPELPGGKIRHRVFFIIKPIALQ